LEKIDSYYFVAKDSSKGAIVDILDFAHNVI
jgi:hypothetical protein